MVNTRLRPDPNDVMDERHSPPGAQKGVRKAVWISVALVVMFLLAIGVAATSIETLKRPGADPGSVQKALAD